MATPGGNLGFNPFQQTATVMAQSAADNGTLQGAITGVRDPLIHANDKKNSAPSKADAAPNANTITVFTGLCDALNQFQKNLVDSKVYDIADVYEVQFTTPPDIGQEQVTLPGTISYKSTGMANLKTPNAQLNTETDNLQKNSRIIQVQAGTQIVQFMDQVIRNSTYITKQANITINEQGVATPTANNSTQTSGFMWYKLTFQVENLGYDSKRNDFAYKMIFVVNQYPVTDITSQFFAPGSFRGVHKSYSYWFTGTNSQVLSFEQDYNNTYYQILMSPPEGLASPGGATTGAAVSSGVPTAPAFNLSNLPNVTKGFAPGAQQSSQGADNGAGLIGASAADWLYSITNRGSITLKIVGDPAWLQQGEAAGSINVDGFSWGPFNKDGSINFDASDIMFDITFNRPGDYNFNTGLVDVTAPSVNPQTGAPTLLQPQAHLLYTATKVVSTFSQGKFTQDLHGKAYLGNFEAALAAANGRQTSATANVSPGTRQALLDSNGNVTKESEADPNRWGSEPDSPTATTQADQKPVTQPSPQPASPASAPTTNTGTAVPQGTAPPSPLTADQANQLSFNPLRNFFKTQSFTATSAAQQTSAPKDE